MAGYRGVSLVALAVCAFIAAGTALAETWELRGDDTFGEVGADNSVIAAAEIKRLVDRGDCGAVERAIAKFKKEHPEAAGADFDAFMKAEKLYCKGKVGAAFRAYEKFVNDYPQSDLYEAALERQYSAGRAYLAGEKKTVLGIFRIKGYEEGKKIMEKVRDRAGASPIGLKAAVKVAESFENQEKYEDAYLEWSLIRSQWPENEINERAMLALGRCKHAAYRGPAYDGSSLVSARSFYEEYAVKYPARAEEYQLEERMEVIDEQAAYKEFMTANYYRQTDSEQAANMYYEMVIEQWPGSQAAEMSKAVLAGDLEEKEKGWRQKAAEKIEKWFL